MTLWSYTVTYLPSTDITAYVTEISDVTIPTNEVRSAEFTLRAKDGAFRTIDNSGATPKLTKYDKIKIEFRETSNPFAGKKKLTYTEQKKLARKTQGWNKGDS